MVPTISIFNGGNSIFSELATRPWCVKVSGCGGVMENWIHIASLNQKHKKIWHRPEPYLTTSVFRKIKKKFPFLAFATLAIRLWTSAPKIQDEASPPMDPESPFWLKRAAAQSRKKIWQWKWFFDAHKTQHKHHLIFGKREILNIDLRSSPL